MKVSQILVFKLLLWRLFKYRGNPEMKVGLLYDISVMIQICYDIVRYLSHVLDMLRYCTLFQTCFRYVAILYSISDMFQICYDTVRYFRHVADMLRYCTIFQTCFRYVTILYDISDMFQICYDIVWYFRHISSGFWTQYSWSCMHPASLILRGVRDHKAKWRQFLNWRCVQISNLDETRHWGRSLSENLICDGSHNGTKRNPLYLGRLHKWFMLVKC